MDDFIKRLKSIDVACLLLAIALILAVFDMPYGYYTFIKIFSTIVFGLLAYNFNQEKRYILFWIAIIATILFQPIIPVKFDRDTWAPINLIIAVALIILVFANYKNSIEEKKEDLPTRKE